MEIIDDEFQCSLEDDKPECMMEQHLGCYYPDCICKPSPGHHEGKPGNPLKKFF